MYSYGKRSLSHLEGAHPDLKKVALLAIKKAKIDFGIIDGERTMEEQKEMLNSGASKTMKSRHLPMKDGVYTPVKDGGVFFALDNMAFVNGKGRWEFDLYYKIAEAYQEAARELNIPIVWGGCWSVINDEECLKCAVKRYVDRKKKQGRKPLLDGPHFQLDYETYPV